MNSKIANPFNVSFGEKPSSYISRDSEFDRIVSTFNSPTPESKALIITGPRGCGKTVMLSIVKKHYDTLSDWITVDLNPFEDMAEQLASKIYDKGKLRKLFLKTEFNFSFSGISFSIKGDNKLNNIHSLLEKIFVYLKAKNTKVLITIDDVLTTDNLKSFCYTYQSFLENISFHHAF